MESYVLFLYDFFHLVYSFEFIMMLCTSVTFFPFLLCSSCPPQGYTRIVDPLTVDGLMDCFQFSAYSFFQ